MSRNYSRILGATPNPADEIALRIGKIEFTRWLMAAKLRSTNYKAAAILTAILKHMGITSVRQLAGTRIDDIKTTSHKMVERGLLDQGAGVWTLFVACCLLAWKDYNYEKWIAGETGDIVTLATFVHRPSKKPAKKRRARRSA